MEKATKNTDYNHTSRRGRKGRTSSTPPATEELTFPTSGPWGVRFDQLHSAHNVSLSCF